MKGIVQRVKKNGLSTGKPANQMGIPAKTRERILK